MRKDISLFLYYLLYEITRITTVYRIYRAHAKPILILVAIGIEEVTTSIAGHPLIDIAWAKVAIRVVNIHSRRGEPIQLCPNNKSFLFRDSFFTKE